MIAWLEHFFSMPLVILMSIVLLGYILGSAKFKGISLGSAGVLIVGLVFGHFGFIVDETFKNWGQVCFIAAVGFSAGPVFFRIFQQKAFSFMTLAITVVLIGLMTTFTIIKVADIPAGLALGLFNGALTSTPGLAAATEAMGTDAMVGYGIAYPFGVICVLMFIQLTPRFLNVDLVKMADQKKKKIALSQQAFVVHSWHDSNRHCLNDYPLSVDNIVIRSKSGEEKTLEKEQKIKAGDRLILKGEEEAIVHDIALLRGPLCSVDPLGVFNFCLVVLLGLVLAQIKIPLFGGATFSLGTSGGPLIVGLIMGYLGSCFRLSLQIPKATLTTLQEIGILFFLAGAGSEAGQSVVSVLQEYGVMLFALGAIITIVPLFLGYFLARGIFKLDLLDTLGAMCGSMTSTPSLGALISVSKSDLGAAIYAVTYPIALVMMIISAQITAIIF